MIRRLTILLFAGLVGLAAATLTAQQDVALYLEPDTSAPVYFEESRAFLENLGPRVWEADPAWQWVEYPGTFVGYVPTREILKNQTAAPGTVVRLRPEPDAPVLTRLDETTVAPMISSGEQWSSVYYEGTAPAYFRTEMPEEEPVPVVGLQDGPALEPVEPPPVEGGIDVGDISPARPAESGPPGSRAFSGVLRAASPFQRVFHPSQRFVLENDSGVAIGFADLTDARKDRAGEAYIGKSVVILGEATRVRGRVPLLIKARTISLQ
ncbi:MAG: hypothetical protein ACFB21_05040 [Opitutales bacterium]